MTRPSVLISGASIAGPALAAWLHRYGWSTTIVERAPQLRTGGQNVDVRGAGREVVRRMGLEEQVRAANTGELGLQFIDDGGDVVAAFPAGTSDTDGATAELEILRGDLAALLVENTRAGTEFVFDDRITAIDQGGGDDEPVTVSFARGADRRFDLVVVADGMRSRTRALVFGDEATLRPLGLYTSYLTIPRTSSDTPWWRWHNATRGRSVTLRPDNVGTTRATLSFLSGPRGHEDLDEAGQKQVLRDTFAGVGWEAPRVLAALGDAELYFESTGQVRAPRWSAGRVALLGDAAHCASPISGMGSSLALVGAYVLAGEIAAHGRDHRAAFTSYERTLRPYVAKAQKLPPGAPRIANPTSRAGIAVFRAGLRVAASPLVGRVGGALFSPPADDIALPTYVPVPAPEYPDAVGD